MPYIGDLHIQYARVETLKLVGEDWQYSLSTKQMAARIQAENRIVIEMTRTVIRCEWSQQQDLGSLPERCFVNPFTTVKWVELATDAASWPCADPRFTPFQKESVGSRDSSGIATTDSENGFLALLAILF